MQPYTPHFLCNQATRTAQTRQYLYHQAEWDTAPLSIDLGCGTGVITHELTEYIPNAQAIGIDIDPDLLTHAKKKNHAIPSVHLLLADATALPFRKTIASFVLSHFTMMWIPQRKKALTEVLRTLRLKGIFSAIEPDYSGRIEEPREREQPSQLPIIDFLLQKNADPFVGCKLPLELKTLGFENVHFGILSWEFDAKAAKAEILDEISLLQTEGIRWSPPKISYTPIFWIHASKSKG